MELALWGIKLATLALAIGGCGVVQGHEGVANMTIYYVPFGVETLTPITSTNIQERGRRCEIHTARRAGGVGTSGAPVSTITTIPEAWSTSREVVRDRPARAVHNRRVAREFGP